VKCNWEADVRGGVVPPASSKMLVLVPLEGQGTHGDASPEIDGNGRLDNFLVGVGTGIGDGYAKTEHRPEDPSRISRRSAHDPEAGHGTFRYQQSDS
jgi:hypothetical protein